MGAVYHMAHGTEVSSHFVDTFLGLSVHVSLGSFGGVCRVSMDSCLVQICGCIYHANYDV